MSDYSVHIVIDNGASTTKVGFNGENAPRVVIPTVIGQTKNEYLNLVEDPKKIYVGREAINNSSYLNLKKPIKNGNMDVEQMEKLWSYIFSNELKIKPEAHNIFLTESLFSSNQEREKIAEIMFEKFSVFNINIEPQQVMSLYSTTKTTGLLVESGEDMTEIVPIYEGFIIPQGIKFNNIAGSALTNYLNEQIKTNLRKFNVSNEFYLSKKIKEKYCELSLNENVNQKLNENLTGNYFLLPDGNSIEIGNEKFLVPELMFAPDLINSDCKSVQQLIFDSISNVDIHLRKDFLNNIVLSGGNTLIKNFSDRLKIELNKIYIKNSYDTDVTSINRSESSGNITGNTIKINAQAERQYSAWIGASVVCSISSFQHLWISKNDFEEIGPQVIHKKNFI